TFLLTEILNRIELPPFGAIPDKATMRKQGRSDWAVPHTEITISKVSKGPCEGQYLFTPKTVSQLESFYTRAKHLPCKPDSWENPYESFIFSPGQRIKVGIAYGTDIEAVEEILMKRARENELAANNPAPRVRFRAFGDSSLDFELPCWARRPEEKGRLIHSLNKEIYNALNKAGIIIPFPQRDVHLISSSETAPENN
ncbi:MAG: mechanosensitive ion channel, partial [Deltaproteobacteria bacterium]|nr:mechanosensitive ion channel [Deltaproteobacteria bacterium]